MEKYDFGITVEDHSNIILVQTPLNPQGACVTVELSFLYSATTAGAVVVRSIAES